MSLTELKPIPNQELVGMLESLVEEAKTGSIQSAAVCVVKSNCATGNCFVGDYYPASLIGELRILERDLVDLCVDTRLKPMPEFCY
tara:strand:- start:1167 stop:1424 length:258 start_codon:yes stop_codon:yes gene_type:complete